MKVARTRNSFTRMAMAIAAAGLSTTLTPLVSAQDSVMLEEIIVSARKVQESAQTVPVAITAFSGAQVDDLIMRDIREMEGYIPNVVIDAVSVAPGGASLYFRGVGTQEVERSVDPAVGVVIDGVPLSFVNGSMVNTFDFESMEILRGPQGSLFGRNTTGGVVNIRRTRPTGELGARYELTAGSDDLMDAKVVVNFPITDTLSGKIGAATQQDGGGIKNTTIGDDVGNRDNTEFTATLLWEPAENFDALFTYAYFEDQNDGVPLVGRSELPDLSCVFGYCDTGKTDETSQDFYTDDIDFELDAYSLEMNWELEAGTITSILGYRDTDESVPTDFDGTGAALFHTIRDQESDQTTAEIRFASSDSISENFDFVVGAFYLDDSYELEQFTAILEILGPDLEGNGALYQNPSYSQDREAWAVFGETHINIAEDWTLTLGGRYSYEEKDFKSFNQLAFGVPEGFFPIGAAADDEDWDETTVKAGIDYQASEELMYYFTYAEGFRSGGYNGRNFTPDTIGPYDPEFLDQYELGMKGDFFDRTLRLNANVFYSDYSDKQEEVIIPDGFGATATVINNASTVDIYGAEAELTWVANENFLITANAGYLDAEYNDYVADITGDGIETDNSNLDLRRIPEWTAGLTGTYTRNIGPGVLSVFGAARYTDEYWVEVSNDPRGLIDSRTVIDATISYEWEWSEGRMVKIAAFGRDLTDEQDYSSLVVVPGLFAFSGVSGGEEYGVQISGTF